MNDRIFELATLGSVGGWFRRRGKRIHVEVGKPCANCAVALQGPWCFNCGQSAEDMHRSAWKLAAEALEGLFHADGRLWKTLPDLLVHPGRLTSEFLNGKRVPQVPPFNMFLIVLVVVFFAGHLGTSHQKHETATHPATSVNGETTAEQRRQTREGIAHAREQMLKNVGPAAAQVFDGQMAPVLAKLQAQDAAEAARKAAARKAKRAHADSDADSDVASDPADSDAAPATPPSLGGHTNLKVQGTPIVAGDGDRITIANGKYKFLNDWAEARYKAVKANPKQFALVMETWAHRVAILTLPVSALLLTILFAFNRRFFVFDHLVFSMHSLSFQLLLASGIFLLSMAVGGVAWWLLWLSPVHLYKHMRGVYGRGRFLTLVTMFLLFVGTSIGFSLLGLVWFILGFNEMGSA